MRTRQRLGCDGGSRVFAESSTRRCSRPGGVCVSDSQLAAAGQVSLCRPIDLLAKLSTPRDGGRLSRLRQNRRTEKERVKERKEERET